MFRLVTLYLPLLIVFYASALAQKSPLNVKLATFRHPAPGYFLLAPNSPDSIALLDHAGKNVFAKPASSACTFQFADSTVTHFIANKRVFVRRNAQMQVIDTLRMSGTYPVDFHTGHMLPNGNYIILGADNRTIDMSVLVPGGNTAAIVAGAVFQERTLGGTTVFEWKSLDHIPVTDATEDIELTQQTIDYIHINSITIDTDGNYLVSCRHLDEVIKINRLTGSVMWRMGGSKSKGNQFTFLDDTENGFTGFSHQHKAFRTAAGRIMMLDNGNLKPTQYSRAVEYEIDETLKTARRTWVFRPTPDIFSFSMGSVQELPNGNIVMGWGQAMSPIIAHEVARDGTIQAELQTDSVRLVSYSVQKAVFAMSGSERVVTAPGTYTFISADSNTRVAVALTRVDAPTSIITERHSLLPHNLEFTGSAPCEPLTMRWIIRVSDTTKVAGSTRFAVVPLPPEMQPSKLKLYHRPTEGVGKFSEVATTFDAANIVLIANSVRVGEYVLAFSQCPNPKPILPAANARGVSLSPTLTWSEAATIDGYDIELYVAASPTPLYAFQSSRLDTIITGLEPSTLYAWRVRARRSSANPWSAKSQFRTLLESPVALTPNSLPDSLATELRAFFTWTSVSRATEYRIQVYKTDSSTLVLDTSIQSTGLLPSSAFEPHTWYHWKARAQNSLDTSAWSATISFVTIPAPPQLISPTAAQLQIDPNQASLEWEASAGGMAYQLRVYRDVAADPFFQDTISSIQATLPALEDVSRYHWQVRTLSRYGMSEWTDRRWFLTSGTSTLAASILLNPVGMSVVDTLNTTLNWTDVEDASLYYIQLTTKPTFLNPDFEWFDRSATSVTAPMLESGHVYLWRVVGLNEVGSGIWSTTGQFSTIPALNDLLRPLTPIDGSREIRTQSFVTFVTDTSFTGYRAEFSKTADFSTLSHSIGGAISPLPFTLEEGTEYWWRVIGARNGVDVDTGSVATFVTIQPTTVAEPQTQDEAPQSLRQTGNGLTVISVRGEVLEIRGDIGGSHIQVFDIVGRMVGSASVPLDSDYCLVPVEVTSRAVYAVVVMQPNGVAVHTAILLSDVDR